MQLQVRSGCSQEEARRSVQEIARAMGQNDHPAFTAGLLSTDWRSYLQRATDIIQALLASGVLTSGPAKIVEPSSTMG